MTTRTIALLAFLLVPAVVVAILVYRKSKVDAQQATPPTLSGFLTGLVILGAVWANGFLFARFWPDAKVVVEVGVAGALALLILLLSWRIVPRRTGDKERSRRRAIKYVAAVMVFALEMRPHHTAPATTSSASGGYAIFIVPVALGAILALLLAPMMLLTWKVHKAYERGDHRGALRLIDRFGGLVARSVRDDFRTLVLIYAGEPKEAELLIRSLLEKQKQAVLKNELNGTLGQALIDQGRYAEAEALFEQVIQASPQRMGGYDGLAEIRILQGRPREALDLVEQAIQREEARSGLVRKFESYEQGHLWANRAWAEAALGWRARAEQALDRAVAAAGKNKPELAGVHYRAGMLWNVLGSPSKSHEHFQAAQALDPEGRYGKKSRESELTAIS